MTDDSTMEGARRSARPFHPLTSNGPVARAEREATWTTRVLVGATGFFGGALLEHGNS